MEPYLPHTALGTREESIATRAAAMLDARGRALRPRKSRKSTVAAQPSSPKPKESNSTPGAQACCSKSSLPRRS